MTVAVSNAYGEISPYVSDVSIRAGFRRDQMRRGLSSRTITERDRVLDLLTDWGNGVPLAAFTREHLELWLDSRPLSPRARSVYISTLHCFYKWAVDEGFVPTDPTTRIRRPKLPRVVPRPMSDDDLHVAIQSAPPRMKAWLCLAAYEGFRCKEIAGLRREDVLDRHQPPLLRVWNGKGGHEAILPLNPETAAALHQVGMPSRGFVFTRKDGGPVRPATVSAMGNRYLHGLGIEATMHQARHWFGTAVWALTKDMRVTQEMMRHSHPGSTAGYAAFDTKVAQEAVAQVHMFKRRR